MTSPSDFTAVVAEKDALIASQAETIAQLMRRIAELEARLGPPKTPDNSSVPPSQGRKASEGSGRQAKAKPHKGVFRALHPDPTARRQVLAEACAACGADVSQTPQNPREAYDHIEVPAIKPDVTRVTLHGGVCPCCKKKFRATAPADMPPGSPFGPGLRALVVYLRFTQNIALERLARLLSDLLGLRISEGALRG